MTQIDGIHVWNSQEINLKYIKMTPLKLLAFEYFLWFCHILLQKTTSLNRCWADTQRIPIIVDSLQAWVSQYSHGGRSVKEPQQAIPSEKPLLTSHYHGSHYPPQKAEPCGPTGVSSLEQHFPARTLGSTLLCLHASSLRACWDVDAEWVLCSILETTCLFLHLSSKH